MKYFNLNFKSLNDENMKFLDSGGCAEILYDKDYIFKRYFSCTDSSDKISKEMFDLIKSIDNFNLIKLYELYFKKYGSELYSTPDAYTAKFYTFEDKRAICRPTEYMIYNFKALDDLFKIFTYNGIVTNDIKKTNTVITHEGIILIDPDSFVLDKDNPNIAIINKVNLLKLFRSICLNELDSKKVSYASKILNDMIFEIVKNGEDVTDGLSKRLRLYKKTIELFEK